MFEPLNPQRIRSRLPPATRAWLASLEVFESIGSTNTYLVAKAAQEPVDGHACLAEHQSAGRGRRGRTWITPRGGSIALSLAHSVDVPPARLGALSLVVGVAVAVALEQSGVGGVGLKWPNDIYLGGAKLGGILIEVVPLVKPTVAVIGIGINLERSRPELAVLADPIAALSDVRAELPRDDVCAALIHSVHGHVRRFEREGFAPFRSAFERRDVFAGALVTVGSGHETLAGRVAGVGAGGELVLDTEAGERRIASGEVSLRPIAGAAHDLPGS